MGTQRTAKAHRMLDHFQHPARQMKAAALRVEMRAAARGWKVRSGLRLPDFMGIGSPVSASTWLADNLDKHPDVSMSRDKETSLFSRHLDRGLGWYSDQFKHCSGKIVGEFTPAYGKLPLERIRLIHQLVPNVRLILLVRNPIDRAWAAARRTMTKMAEHWGCSFEEVPRDEFIAFFNLETDYNTKLLNRGGVFEKGLKSGHYCQILDNWLSVFPAEQLLPLFYDDIKVKPAEVLWQVFGHIGASSDVDLSLFSTERVNANPKHPMPDWAREKLEELYRPEIERMRQRFGDQLPDWS